HNDISNILSTTPHRFAPMHRRKPNGDIDARPWCEGFCAAMRPRLSAWAPLLDVSNINYGLLLPILVHCADDQGRPLLGPARKGRGDRGFSAKRPSLHSGSRRGHAQILDAAPFRPRRLPSAYVEAHPGYDQPMIVEFKPAAKSDHGHNVWE